jgi:transposase
MNKLSHQERQSLEEQAKRSRDIHENNKGGKELKLTEEEEIYFCDATHPQYQVQEAYGWIRKGQVKTVAATSQQKRLHFAGAICLRDMKVVIKEYPTINSENIVDFFKHLEACSAKKRIHVICDNGTEYNNSSVRHYAQISRICLHYLLPYSPNLNPIERLWKMLREWTCYNRCYPNFCSFRKAICSFLFEKIPKMKQILRKRINDHVERIAINPMKLAAY